MTQFITIFLMFSIFLKQELDSKYYDKNLHLNHIQFFMKIRRIHAINSQPAD